MEIIGNDGESLTKVTSPVKKKRKVSRKLNEDDEEHDKPYLSKKLGFIDRELRKRKQQLLLDDSDSNLEAESSRSASRQFTLDELKYADFLQPKVVLSNSLSVLITRIMSQASSEHNFNISNLLFHNYAKPFDS